MGRVNYNVIQAYKVDLLNPNQGVGGFDVQELGWTSAAIIFMSDHQTKCVENNISRLFWEGIG